MAFTVFIPRCSLALPHPRLLLCMRARVCRFSNKITHLFRPRSTLNIYRLQFVHMWLINGREGRGGEGEAGAGMQRKHRLCPGISPGDGTVEGCRASAAFGSVFRLFGAGPSWWGGCVLCSSSDKSHLRLQAGCDKVSAGLCPSTDAASPIPHPPVKCELPFCFPVPDFPSHWHSETSSETLLDLGVVVEDLGLLNSPVSPYTCGKLK